MNWQLYMKRIGFEKQTEPSFDTLSALVHAHAMSVPFENIDIQNKVPIVLDTHAFFDKIVTNGRGGYCYELNGLFYELLADIGYDVRRVMGRVVNGKYIGPEYDHMALIVTIGGIEYLVDVGFGDFALIPLALSCNDLQTDGKGEFLISDHGDMDGRVYKKVEKLNPLNKDLSVKYYFTTDEQQLHDFADMNEHQQNDEDSHFVRNYICTMPTEHGRISILNNKAVFTYKDKKRSRIVNEEERAYLVSKYFGINIEDNIETALRLGISQ